MEKQQAFNIDKRYYLKLTLNEVTKSVNGTNVVDYDIENNTSKVYYKLSLIKTSGTGYYTYSANSPINLSIDGSTIINQNIAYDFRGSTPKEIVVTEGTKTIKHNDDGNKTISYSASFSDGSNGLGSASISGSLILTPIPRASTIGVSDTNIGSTAIIVINRNSEQFKHTLKWSAGGLSGTIVTKTPNQTYPWQVPTSLYSKIPNAKRIEVTVTCETYSNDKLVGTKTAKFNAIVDEEANKPTLSATIEDVNRETLALTNNPQHLIAFFSNAKTVITAGAKNSATIKSYKVVCDDGKIATSQTSTLNGVEKGRFTITVVDSRGISNTIVKTLEIDPYVKLTLNPTVKRKTQTGSKVLVSVNGNYYIGPSSEKGSWNTLTVRYRYKAKTSSDYSGWYDLSVNQGANNTYYLSNFELPHSFNYETQYDFQFEAFDELMLLTSNLTLKVGQPNHWWNKTSFTHLTPVTAPSITQTSLETLKKNIKKFDSEALDIINNSEIYNYNLKIENDTDKKHIGFVIGNSYKTPDEVISQNGQGIDTYSMESILWKAIQELYKKLEELENKR